MRHVLTILAAAAVVAGTQSVQAQFLTLDSACNSSTQRVLSLQASPATGQSLPASAILLRSRVISVAPAASVNSLTTSSIQPLRTVAVRATSPIWTPSTLTFAPSQSALATTVNPLSAFSVASPTVVRVLSRQQSCAGRTADSGDCTAGKLQALSDRIRRFETRLSELEDERKDSAPSRDSIDDLFNRDSSKGSEDTPPAKPKRDEIDDLFGRLSQR